jgi:hypothetical protein
VKRLSGSAAWKIILALTLMEIGIMAHRVFSHALMDLRSSFFLSAIRLVRGDPSLLAAAAVLDRRRSEAPSFLRESSDVLWDVSQYRNSYMYSMFPHVCGVRVKSV